MLEMDNVLNTAAGQGGALTALAERVSSTEAFIILVILIMSFIIWKVWNEFKHMMRDREHIAEKRNDKEASLQSQINELKNTDTKLEEQLSSHFEKHLGIEKKLDSMEEVRDDVKSIGTKLDMIMEFCIKRPLNGRTKQ